MATLVNPQQEESRQASFAARARQSKTNLVTLWNYPLLRPWWSRAVLLAIVLGIGLTRALIGMAGSEIFTHDAFMLFDGAWRMANGQRPHVDFYSHLGALTYLPTLVGLRLAHGGANSFAYGQALVGVVLGAWAYVISRRFLHDVPAALMCVTVTLMAASPTALGFSLFLVAPAMTYNRCGYAILAIILAEAMSERTESRQESDFWGGLSTGVALSLLFFLKITYFATAGFIVAAMLLLRPASKQRWMGLATGFISVLVCGGVYFGFNLVPMFHDLRMVGGAKHFRWRWYAIDSIFQNAGTVLVLVGMAAALLLKYQQKRSAYSIAIGGLCVSLVGVMLLLGNYEPSGFALAPFIALIAIDAVTIHVAEDHSPNLAHFFLVSLGSVLIITSLISGATILPYGVAQKVIKAPRFPRFASPVLRGFIPIEIDAGYTGYVNDGLDLLKTYRRPGETIMSLDFTNPFSYALGAKPAPGGATVLQYNTTFDETHRQSWQSLFGSADLVMLPKQGSFTDGSLEYSIARIYGPDLERNFQPVGASKGWLLYRRLVAGQQ